jgi:hypothetical protein
VQRACRRLFTLMLPLPSSLLISNCILMSAAPLPLHRGTTPLRSRQIAEADAVNFLSFFVVSAPVFPAEEESERTGGRERRGRRWWGGKDYFCCWMGGWLVCRYHCRLSGCNNATQNQKAAG